MSQATEMLDKYLTAEAALLEGKEARFGDRSLKMEDLESIRAGRIEWERRVSAETARAAGARSIGGLSFATARMNGQ